jgi:hypothetical protein
MNSIKDKDKNNNQLGEKQIEEKQTEEKQSEEIFDTDTVITVPNPEVDTLNILYTSFIKLHEYNIEEMARLFRSISILTNLQKRILEVRYLSVVKEYEDRLRYVDFMYHLTRTTISLGSVTVPALLSIQSPNAGWNSVTLYWTTWVLSILVTIFHNFNSIFRFDKKFLGLHTTLEKLKSEGWQYLELSGRYSGHHGHVAPTHLNQYVYFVNSIERIKLKQVEEEYNTIGEADKPPPATGKQEKPINEQAVPSPLDLTINRGKK